jgi:hypothetical protein
MALKWYFRSIPCFKDFGVLPDGCFILAVVAMSRSTWEKIPSKVLWSSTSIFPVEEPINTLIPHTLVAVGL